jgi:hypothetical protein
MRLFFVCLIARTEYGRPRSDDAIFWNNGIGLSVHKEMLRNPSERILCERMLCIWIVKNLQFVGPMFVVISVTDVTTEYPWDHRIGISP